jgi:hypothetical protein
MVGITPMPAPESGLTYNGFPDLPNNNPPDSFSRQKRRHELRHSVHGC